MAKRYEDASDEEREAIVQAACQKAGEVLGDTPYVLIACTLGADGLPDTAQPISPTMSFEQMATLITDLAGSLSSAQPGAPEDRKSAEAVYVAANAKADRVWREMRKNLPALKRVAGSYPTETAGDRLVRDCIFLVYNEVLNGVKGDN